MRSSLESTVLELAVIKRVIKGSIELTMIEQQRLLDHRKPSKTAVLQRFHQQGLNTSLTSLLAPKDFLSPPIYAKVAPILVSMDRSIFG